MPDHLGSIGLRAPDGEALNALLAAIQGELREEARARGSRHLRWTDASGASLALHLEDRAVVCITPFFSPPDGLTRWRVRTAAPREDGTCAHCGGADCDLLAGGQELLSRATVQWLHFAPYRRWLEATRRYDLEVVALASDLRAFADEEAFGRAEHPGLGTLKLAANAFLPCGTLLGGTDMVRAAEATIAGRVSRSELRHNSRGGDFWRLRVATLPGELDMVAAPSAGGSLPPVGSVVLAQAWLVGRPTPPPPQPGLLERLGWSR